MSIGRGKSAGACAWIAGVACFLLLVGGCDDGKDGLQGPPGASTATISGRVTNSLTGAGLPGVTVVCDPAVPGVNMVTDATGTYAGVLPAGVYTFTVTVTDYNPGSAGRSLLAGGAETLDFPLAPTNPVKVSIGGLPGSVGPGSVFNLVANVTPMNGSFVLGYSWTQSNSVDVDIGNGSSQTATITLPDEATYKDELFDHLEVPDRWGPVGINPHALEEAESVTIHLEVEMSDGQTYTADIDVGAHLDFAAIASGINNVPIGLPVLLNGKPQAAYDWAFDDKPGGSGATLNDATTQRPWFVPDVEGLYVLRVTDLSGPSVVMIEIYAGTWRGMIDAAATLAAPDGKPVADDTCNGCHTEIVSEWRETGHAHILTNNVNTSGHYGTGCFACHTVGWDGVDNGGIDSASDWPGMSAGMFPGGSSHADPDNWTTMLTNWPDASRRTNIQCENCHGPQNSLGHMDLEGPDSRVSLSSDVCATCHGEPLRHARFQQWQESGHGDYEVAVGEGWDDGDEEFRSCGACHTANGFVAWVEDGDGDADWRPPSDLVSGPDEIHPITCVACHDPHSVGTTTGTTTDAKMRITGDTPELMAGYSVAAVGNGAVCMTCHNSRRGLRNDMTWPSSDPDRAPHQGPQTDILVSQNAYFVEVGARGPHSVIEDSCVTCHLELTPPPAELSYNLGGTNHTFEASEEVCGNCHGEFTAENLIEAVESAMDDLKAEIEQGWLDEMNYELAQGATLQFDGFDSPNEGASQLLVTASGVGVVTGVELTEWHGRQALNVTFSGGLTCYNLDIDDAEIVGGPNLDDTPNGGVLARAGWNYFLMHADGSHGVHNPGFYGDIFVGTFNALETMLDFTIPE